MCDSSELYVGLHEIIYMSSLKSTDNLNPNPNYNHEDIKSNRNAKPLFFTKESQDHMGQKHDDIGSPNVKIEIFTKY